ncbi:bifunctional nicotinamidase/pyrazinamidase [Amylibacter sp.]|jgi:nicotinamidase/pyrazinamidase|nr:bifunctional nicotinamidase/pyrazinamidase [Amylibacter sp.]
MTQALIMIDIQNDFCPGGALAVEGGDEILGAVNAMQNDFPVRVLTQDWHPSNHSSFADNHEGAEPYSTTEMPYGTQVLWPRHCVIGSAGSAFKTGLNTDTADMIVRKGYNPEIDSYSAFFENDHSTQTGLHGYLQERGVTALTLVGLATDFCVKFSALDGAKLGYRVTVIESACRGIDLGGSLNAALIDMKASGVLLA